MRASTLCGSFVLCLCLVFFQVSAAPLPPIDLRVEYLKSPVIGLDKLHPRFSYRLEVSNPSLPASRSESQSSYQIWVSIDSSVTSGDVWDSGKVASNQTSQIIFVGAPLKSDTSYYWKVRWWNNQTTESSWSSIARFDTGLFTHTDWDGKWIGGFNQLRKEFSVTSPVARARAFICGIGYYELYINGKRVGDSFLDPGWTHYSIRSLYAVYDVTSLLYANGSNAIGVLLGSGWYGQGWNGQRSLLFQLNVQTHTSTIRISSDDSWKGSPGPITYDSIYNGETYDARLEQPGWDTPDFKGNWESAKAIAGPGGKISAQMMPPIKKGTTVNTQTMKNPKSGVYVFDFGQNLSGWARLRVPNCRAGTTITLEHAEILQFNKSGLIYTANLRSAKATDHYTCKGSPEIEIYEPRFTYHGFQFIQMTGYPGTPTKESLEAIHVKSDLETIGKINFENPILDRIQKNIWWGQTSNFMSVPTDCDQRDERLGWMADGQLSVEEAIHNFDVAAFYTNWVTLMHDEIGTDGSMTDTVPFVRYGSRPADPAWGAAYPLLTFWLYEYYGDLQIIIDNYEGLQSYINFLTKKVNSSGFKKMYGSYGDWVPPPPAKRATVSFTSGWYYILNIKNMIAMATAVNKLNDAKQYQELYQSSITKFNEAWYDTKTFSYDIGVQTDYVLPLFLNDMVPSKDLNLVIKNLIHNIEINCEGQLSTGILGTKYLMLSLSQIGYTSLALDLTLNSRYPGWAWEFNNQTAEVPATTIWELWNAPSEGPEMNSRNHIMFGSVSDWFYKYLAGIQQKEGTVGYKHIVVDQPDVNVGLQYVDASLHWLVGEIHVTWHYVPKSYVALNVTVPVNCLAEIRVSTFVSSDKVVISESGKTVWNSGKFVPGVVGIDSALVGGPQTVIFQVGSGSYSFYQHLSGSESVLVSE